MISWVWLIPALILGEAVGIAVMEICAANGRDKETKKDR